MSAAIEEKLATIPVVRTLMRLCKKVVLPGFNGLTLYDLLEIYVYGIIEGTFTTRAGSIAFSFFMALFPFLLFILNLIPFVWFIKDFQSRLLGYLDQLIPPQTHQLFDRVFYDIANTPRTGLLSIVFVLSIFLMTNGINAIFTGFEYSWHTTKKRSIIRQYIVALGVSLIISLLLLSTVIVTIYLTYIIEDLSALGVFDDTVRWAEIGRFVTFVAMIYNVVCILYYFGTKESRQANYNSIGAVFTTVLIVVFTYLFSLYLENFGSYNKLYGSIGALVIAMFYTWLNANILLLGFELNGAILKLRHDNAQRQKTNQTSLSDSTN